MSEVEEIIQRARDIRLRLRRPPNAVIDIGIDLRRHRKNTVEEYRKTLPLYAKVRVTEEEKAKKKIKIDTILKIVCLHYGIGIADLRGSSRRKEYVHPRHIGVHLAYKYCLSPTMSGMGLSRHFHKDHTTLLHAQKKMQKAVDNPLENWKVARDIWLIERRLLSDDPTASV